MKVVEYTLLCMLLAAGMVALGGCKGKNADENQPAAESQTAESTPAAEPQAVESAPAAEVAVDESEPVSEVKTEAETMNAAQLRAAALAYKEAIVAKKAELEKAAAQLKTIPVTELLGEKAKQIKTDVDNLTKSIDALKARFDVFYAALKTKSGDLSGLQL